MRDFQDLLKLFIEAEDESPNLPSSSGPMPGAFNLKIEEAQNPREAFQAYSNEYKTLLANAKNAMEMSVNQLVGVRQQLVGMGKNLGSLAGERQKIAGFGKPMPTANPNLAKAMADEPGANFGEIA